MGVDVLLDHWGLWCDGGRGGRKAVVPLRHGKSRELWVRSFLWTFKTSCGIDSCHREYDTNIVGADHWFC